MKNRIYFFANFGDWSKIPFGGGEVGNRRTLALLKKLNYDIVLIPKYIRVNDHSLINSIELLFKIISNIFLFAKTLINGQRKGAIVHIAGFYGIMIYFEYLLIAIAKVLHYKVIYEMRGGGANKYYEEGHFLYKFFFKRAIRRSDEIFSQGKENFSLIKKIDTNKRIFYYPNYVQGDFYPQQYPQKPKDKINLMYFGRLSKTKNTDIVINTFILLAKEYNNVYLEIIGNSESQFYTDYIKNKIKESNLESLINILPAFNHKELKKHLVDKSFYIFPSKEPREGHSNALTEAMAWGLIPITTSQGFNRSVIENDSLIVEKLDVKCFVNKIKYIIDNDLIEQFSYNSYNRVLSNYTDEIVLEKLKEEYDFLFNVKFTS